MTTKTANRRTEPRKRLRMGARYVRQRSSGAAGGRAEILNVSYQGGRAIVGKEVKLGDRLQLLACFQGDTPTEISSMVRWRQELPGGFRQVVGLQLLPD